MATLFRPMETSRSNNQEGAMAIEFSIIFLVLFFLIYFLLSVGLIFAAQQSLNVAAQEGIRSLLRFYPPSSLSQSEIQRAKWYRALDIAKSHTEWIDQLSQASRTAHTQNVTITLCNSSGYLLSTNEVSTCDFTPPLAHHEIAMIVKYDYGKAPIIPSLGLIGIYNFAFSELILSNTQRISTTERWEAQP